MKRKIFVLLLIAQLAFLVITVFALPSIPIATNASATNQNSFALDMNNRPVIAFWAGSPDRDLRLAICDAPECLNPTFQTVDSPGNVGGWASVVLNSSDYPRIAYHDADLEALKLANCADTACSSANIIQVDTNLNTTGSSPDIRLNNQGYPVISYWDGTNWDAKLAVCEDVDCSSIIIRTLDGPNQFGQWTSLGISSANNPVISYYDQTTWTLYVAVCGDSTCSTFTRTAIDSGYYNSTQINASDTIFIAYIDFTGNLKLAVCPNLDCSSPTITVIDDSAGGSLYPSIALDSNGNPIISYFFDGEYDLRVAQCADPLCTERTIQTLDTEGMVGIHTALKLDDQDNLYIVHNDYTNNRVMYYHSQLLPVYTSDVAPGNTITLSGATGMTQVATLSISNTGDAGSLLDVSQVGTLTNFTIGSLPQDLTPVAGGWPIEISCVVPQASETLTLQSNETGNPTYSYTLECLATEVTPEVTPEITPEITPEVTPEITPEVTPETTPEVTPEITPEVTDEPDRVTICHVAGRADDPANYVILNLPISALNGHLDNNGTPRAGHEDDFIIESAEDGARCGIDDNENPGSDDEPDNTNNGNRPNRDVFDPAISKIGFLLPGEVGVTGEQLQWIVTVSNPGNVTGQNVVVTDTLVAALRVDRVDAPGATVIINGQTVTVTYATLNPGETRQFSIFTTVLDGVEVSNTACVHASNQATMECAEGDAIAQLPQTGESPLWRQGLWLLLLVPLAGLLLVRRKFA